MSDDDMGTDDTDTDTKTTILAANLEDLWYAEGCSWTIGFEGGAGDPTPWLVTLEWTQESGNLHGADWVTYTWEFYGTTIEEALGEAITWCEGLLPFERCEACDGEGSYNGRDGRVTCEVCNGSGLERDADARTG